MPGVHKEMCLLTLTYLMLEAFFPGPCYDGAKLRQRKASHPLIDYSAKEWPRHVAEINKADSDVYDYMKGLFETRNRLAAFEEVRRPDPCFVLFHPSQPSSNAAQSPRSK
jgi:hypothetical protein